MTSALALARAELIMLTRNRTAAVTALVLPLGGGLWIITDTPAESPLGSVAAIAALQLLTVVGFTMISSATTTLVARRQQRVLELWRTTPATTHTILAGTLAPATALLVVQTGILFAATGIAAGSPPDQPLLLAGTILLAALLGGAVAFVTAAATRSVEAASVTMLPALIPLVGGGIWVTTAAAGQVTWPMRATGGGALVELVMVGWEGPAGNSATLAAAAPSILMLLILTVAASLAATHTFRWQTRG